MSAAHLKLTNEADDGRKAITGINTRVELDGVDISSKTHSVHITAVVGEPLVAEIGVYVGNLEMDADVEAKLRDLIPVDLSRVDQGKDYYQPGEQG